MEAPRCLARGLFIADFRLVIADFVMARPKTGAVRQISQRKAESEMPMGNRQT